MLTDKRGNFTYANAIAFITLSIQTAATVLMMRYAQLPSSNIISKNEIYPKSFAKTSAVATAEFGKMWVGILVTFYNLYFHPKKQTSDESQQSSVIELFIDQVFGDTYVLIKMSVPATIYAIQNYLLFQALHHLDSSVYQVMYQIKTFTAALFSILLLNKTYSALQWLSFILLAFGAALANYLQLDANVGNKMVENVVDDDIRDPITGIICLLMATCTSGFAGVFMELQLKQAKVSLYVKNIQLGLFGFLVTIIVSYFNGELFSIVIPFGFFCNFSHAVWIVVLLNIFGGYLVAYVLKNASNIIKAFASGIAVLFIVVGSWAFFDTQFTVLFGIPVLLVSLGNLLYNREIHRIRKLQGITHTV